LQTAVQLMANTEYYVVSYETAMVADVFFDQDTIVDTGMTDVAQVTSAVFSTDTDPNDPMPPNVYEPPPIPTGNTYGPVDFIYEVPA